MIKVYFAMEICLIMFKKRTLRDSYYIQRKIKYIHILHVLFALHGSDYVSLHIFNISQRYKSILIKAPPSRVYVLTIALMSLP